MEKIQIDIKITKYRKEELSEDASKLMAEAIQAASSAYAPYSKFCVGAAVLLENGVIVTGSNQENAAYPSGLCAERVALFHAGHQYLDVPVVALAIAAKVDTIQVERISPCGACRQVLLEMEQRSGKAIKIMLCGRQDILVVESASVLLPLCFGTKNLDF